MNIERVLVQAISVSLGHRKVDPAIVDSLAESMKRLGMLSPIIVRVITEDNIHLIAGRHRLEAAKRLGWGMIEAHCFTGDDTEARMREITENLHRSELTVLERASQIEEWRVLCQQNPSAQVGHSGGSPQRGVSQAAKELGVSRQEVERAEKIASITPSAKAAAKEAGIDDNQSKLLQVAASEPEKQVEAVKEAAKKSAAQKAADTRRRNRKAKAKAKREAKHREREVLEREMGELASKLIALDRDIARAIYETMRDIEARLSFRSAIEERLGLIEEIPDDEPDADTSDDTSDDTRTTTRPTIARPKTAGSRATTSMRSEAAAQHDDATRSPAR